jgi:hypothetical protein
MTTPTLAEIAQKDIGLKERPQHDNRGDDIMKFFLADDLEIDGRTDGYAWCASACSYWVQQRFKARVVTSVKPPRIASVSLFVEWAKKWGLSVRTKNPKPNDLVVFKFSHIGVVVSVDNANGCLHTVEGNTNQGGSREGFEVAAKKREFEECKYFISLP